MFLQMIQGLKELVFPDNCFLCQSFLNSRHTRQLCDTCLKSIKRNTPPFCATCSRHLDHFTEDSLCQSCRTQKFTYDRAWGACFYEEPVRTLLHNFKYHGKTALRTTCVALMTEFIDVYHMPVQQFDLVCPIPLHPVRLRERGFNQAQLLSDGICRRYQLTHEPHALIRQQATDAQAHLEQKQRFTNLKGAFKMNPSLSVTDKSILLVDDLLTTGATAASAAGTLKEAGAAYVGALTLAMTK